MQYGDPTGSHDIDLTMFDDDFETIEVERDDFVSVPDGKYQVNVDRVELTKSQNDNPMIKWTFRILAPIMAGRLLWKNSVITDRSLKWVKKDLVCAGLQLNRFSDLDVRLEELVNIQLEVTKKTKGEDENVYINQRIVIDGAAAENDFDDPMKAF